MFYLLGEIPEKPYGGGGGGWKKTPPPSCMSEG